jgi:ADP-ribose pyrophosphatase YjhB (NUDIX family)
VEEWDKSASAAATREAREEAGVSGQVRGSATGLYSYYTRRRGRPERITAAVFVLDVDKEHPPENWPESGSRRRHWMPAGAAYKALKHDWQRAALKSAGLVRPGPMSGTQTRQMAARPVVLEEHRHRGLLKDTLSLSDRQSREAEWSLALRQRPCAEGVAATSLATRRLCR